MHIKSILLKVLVLAMLLPTVALAQQPTKTELYDQCMRETNRPSAPLYLEEADKYQARMKARYATAVSICHCKVDVQMTWMKKLNAMGFDGSKAAAKKAKANPELINKMMLTMSAEESACYDKYRP